MAEPVRKNTGAFVLMDDVKAALPGKPIPGALGKFVSVLSDDTSKYGYGTDKQFKDGTTVPRASHVGGIEGSRNPYGQVVMGKAFRGSSEIPIGDFQPRIILEAGKEIETIQELPVTVKEISVDVIKKMAKRADAAARKNKELDATIDDLLNDTPEGMSVVQSVLQEEKLLPQQGAPQTPQDPTPAPAQNTSSRQEAFAEALLPKLFAEVQLPPIRYGPDKPKVTASLSGSFGTFRGKYLEISELDSYVILVYDPVDSVFIPPMSMEVLTVSCPGKKLELYFSGIDFVLERYNIGVQVYIPPPADKDSK